MNPALTPSDTPYRLNIDQIRRFLPHRPPFLLVDRILGVQISDAAAKLGDLSTHLASSDDKVGTQVWGLKNVSYNEGYFQGHFPSFSILPGVLILETMAQVASFSIYPYLAKDIDGMAGQFQCILVGVDSARFRKPVVPGDALQIHSTVSKCRGRLWAFQCVATVDGKTVADAEILANLIPKGEMS